jgi:hypothetical protein
MRLFYKTFMSAAALMSGTAALAAQPQGYEPPPVEFAEQAEPTRPTPSRVAPPEEQGPPPQSRAPRIRPRVNVGGFVDVQAGVSAELGRRRQPAGRG